MKRLYFSLFLISTAMYCNCQTILEQCVAEISVDKDDPHPVVHAQDPKLDCFNACIAKKTGEIVSGKISEEKYYDMFKRYFKGSLAYLRNAISECASIANEEKDECAMANVIRNCLMEKLVTSSS